MENNNKDQCNAPSFEETGEDCGDFLTGDDNLENVEEYNLPAQTQEYINESTEIGSFHKEEIQKYQSFISRLNYLELLNELTKYTGKDEVFNALRKYLDLTKSKKEKLFTIPYKDRFDNLPANDKINCYKLERLINQVILKYKEEGVNFKLVNEKGELLKSLVQNVYDSFDVNLEGVESQVIEVILGYGGKDLRKTEIELEKEKLEDILKKGEKETKRINHIKKGLTYGAVITPLASLAAYAFNLGDTKTILQIGTAVYTTLVSLLPWIGYKNYKSSENDELVKKAIEAKKKNIEDINTKRDINTIESYLGF